MNIIFRVFSFIVVLILASCAEVGPVSKVSGKTTIRVTGFGLTQLDAQKAGFRDAIQQAYGSLMLSERRVTDEKLFEDDVSYARGVIDGYQILSSRYDKIDQLYRIDMLVSVSPASIERRVFDAHDSKNVDGKRFGKEIGSARVQIESESERYLQAKRLLEHFSKDVGLHIFNVRGGDIAIVKNRGVLNTSMPIYVELDKKVLTDFCFAAKEYGDTKSAVRAEINDRSSKKLIVSAAYGCRVTVQLEEEIFDVMLKSLVNAGVCVDFIDASGVSVAREFYFPKFVDDGMYKNDGTPSYGMVCVEEYCRRPPREFGASFLYESSYSGPASVDSSRGEVPNVIRFASKAWGNEVEFNLNLPDLAKFNLSEVKTRVATRASCGK